MTKRNFLGIPVDGEIIKDRVKEKQKTLEELRPLLQAVLDDPTIVEFGWHQYTPYYNDGDPCEFGVYGFWVRTTEDGGYLDANDLGVLCGHPSLGSIVGKWVGKYPNRKWVIVGYEGPDEDRYNRVAALAQALENGEFDDVLFEAFGDHADVTVRKSGITVEFYEHD